MRGPQCVRCAGMLASKAKREGVVRKWAAAFAQTSSAGYPLLYRLVERLPLCAGCLETMPAIGADICTRCGRDGQQSQLTKWREGEPHPRLCRDCVANAPSPLRANRSLLRYDEWGREPLGLYKYRGDERLAELFSLLLTIALYCHYQPKRIDCLTAVPLHVKRLRERGFNQMELLAARVAVASRIPSRPLLLRTRETKKQSQQTGRAARRQGMLGAFAANAENFGSHFPHRSKPYTILLLDDVYTTGSTLRECARTIQDSQHAEMYIYSLTIYR